MASELLIALVLSCQVSASSQIHIKPETIQAHQLKCLCDRTGIKLKGFSQSGLYVEYLNKLCGRSK